MTRRKKTKILLIGTLLLIAAVFLFIRQLNEPAVGTLESPPLQTEMTEKKEEGTKVYDGKLISFTYPGGYEKVEKPSNSSGYLEVINMISGDHANTHLAVAVIRGDLANEPGVSLRKSRPDIYRSVLNTPNDLVFESSQNGTEKTRFIANNGMIATISLTSPSARNINYDFAVVSDSFRWQQ